MVAGETSGVSQWFGFGTGASPCHLLGISSSTDYGSGFLCQYSVIPTPVLTSLFVILAFKCYVTPLSHSVPKAWRM